MTALYEPFCQALHGCARSRRRALAHQARVSGAAPDGAVPAMAKRPEETP
jgi:hypothetical protein